MRQAAALARHRSSLLPKCYQPVPLKSVVLGKSNGKNGITPVSATNAKDEMCRRGARYTTILHGNTDQWDTISFLKYKALNSTTGKWQPVHKLYGFFDYGAKVAYRIVRP